MERFLPYLLIVTMISNAQIVTIPDANFKAKLLSASSANNIAHNATGDHVSIDTNGNGQIELAEALVIDYLNVDSSNIASLEGIEDFLNLRELRCNSNLLTALDLSALTNLRHLECSDNQLHSINVLNCSMLSFFESYDNPFNELDLHGLLNLSYINIGGLAGTDPAGNLNLSGSGITALGPSSVSGNFQTVNLSDCVQLTSVWLFAAMMQSCDVSGCSSLTSLRIGGSGAASVDLSGCGALQFLNFDLCNLSSLDLNDCPMLTDLTARQNHLTTLDLSHQSALQRLDLTDNNLTAIDFTACASLKTAFLKSNPISSLDFSACHQLQTLDLSEVPITWLSTKNGSQDATLYSSDDIPFICADDFDTSNNPGVGGGPSTVVSSYCTFVPGGDYNTIAGNVLFDSNGNGCDPSDIHPNFVRIDISDGTFTGASFVSTSSNLYTFYVEAGNFDLTPSTENPSIFNFSPTSANIPFADDHNNIVTQDFCMTANGVHPDLEIVIVPIGPARPGFDAIYDIIYRNKGNQVMSQLNGITFSYNYNQMDYSSSTVPPSVNNIGSLAWDFADLMPFESRQIEVGMHIHSPTDANPVSVDDVLELNSTILPLADENPQDNIFDFNQVVIGSFDPNNIICLEGSAVASSKIGDFLHYVVNFENTGTDAAQNIVVRIPIDGLQYNLDSMQLMYASHPVEAKLTGNIAEFIFKDISLPINGHGYIVFKMRTNIALSVGDIVSSTGNIFFDYNAPVNTGVANTSFEMLSNQEFNTDRSIVAYPNPTTGKLKIDASSFVTGIRIFDFQGRLLTRSAHSAQIDLSRYQRGIYYIVITTEKGSRMQKVILK